MSDDQQQSEPSDDEPVDPRFADDPVTVHGKPRRRRRKLSKIEQNTLIEEIRELQLLEHSKSEVLSRIKTTWGLTRKSIKRYVSYACKRNRSYFGGDDSVAISVGWWADEKREAIERFKTEKKTLEIARQTYMYAEKQLRHADAGRDDSGNPVYLEDAERSDLVHRQETAGKLMESCRKAMFGAKQDAQNAQREIDRIKGNIVNRFARTDTKGNDVATLTPEQIAEGMKLLKIPGFEPLRFPPPKVIEAKAVDVTPEQPPATPTNGHTNGHVNGKQKPGVNGTNGHAKPKPKPETGGGDELQ